MLALASHGFFAHPVGRSNACPRLRASTRRVQSLDLAFVWNNLKIATIKIILTK
jgi:hypothetical protein